VSDEGFRRRNAVDDEVDVNDINVAATWPATASMEERRSVLDYITRSIATEPDAVVLEPTTPAALCVSASTWPNAIWAA